MLALQRSIPAFSFNASVLEVSNGIEYACIDPAALLEWQVTFGTAPDDVTVLLQGSLDGTNWFTLDSTTSVTGALRRLITSVTFVRARVSAVTNGEEVTVSILEKPIFDTALFTNLRNLGTNIDEVQNVDGDLTDLISVSVPANTLIQNGDSVRVIAVADYAANANNKSIFLLFAGTSMIGRTDTDNNSNIIIEATITRLSATSVLTAAKLYVTTDSGVTSLVSTISASADVTNELVLRSLGVATGDITSKLLKAEYIPAGVLTQ